MSHSLWLHESQHTRPPCPSPSPGVHSNSRPSHRWCHPAISSSVVPFSSCPQSLPASESFPMSQLFAWGGQSTGVSATASGLPKNTQDWSPLEWTGWISLQSKGLSRVFSSTTVRKHQFFGTQPHTHTLTHTAQQVLWSRTRTGQILFQNNPSTLAKLVHSQYLHMPCAFTLPFYSLPSNIYWLSIYYCARCYSRLWWLRSEKVKTLPSESLCFTAGDSQKASNQIKIKFQLNKCNKEKIK